MRYGVGEAGCGKVRYGVFWFGKLRCGKVRQGTVWYGMVFTLG